jgi:hypothetical protein
MNQYQPHSNVTFEDRQTMNKFINANKANPFITRIEPVRDSKDTLQVSFRDEQSKAQFESKIDESIKLMRTPPIQKKKQTRKAKPVPGDKVKRLGSTKTMLKAGKGKHDCASKVEHAEWGVGSCIREQHAAPDAEGNIAWYDVMFEHGLEKQVSTDDLDILISEMHEDHDHHNGEELDEKVSSLKKSDAPFTVVATKGGKVLDQMNSIELSDVKDAIKFMKADKKGAKISVEAKGGKVVHTESRDRFDYLDRQAASQDRDFAAKKFMDALKKAGIKAKYHRSLGKVEVEKGDLRKAQGIGKRLKVDKEGVRIDGTLNRSFKGVFDKNEDVNEARFNPSKNPTSKLDKEFDDARDALRKAGIPHMGQRAIGSMNRERNRLRVHPKFEKEARKALRGFPKVDLEINDKMPQIRPTKMKPLPLAMKRKREGVEEAVKYPHNMYDPKTGKRYVAKNREDHMRMSRMGYDHVPKAMNKSTMKEANDPHMVTELYLFITNDSNLNRQMIQSLIKNYRKKLAKGSYDEELAIKGFMNVVNAGVKAYAKEFSVGERMKVSKSDRQEVAKKLSNFYRDDIMHGY